jgi:hypothetical protein
MENHVAASMINCESDFIDTLKQSNIAIQGIKGHLSTSKMGTVKWIIQDQKGRPN